MALKEVKYTAIIIESEKGWGRKIDSTREFDSEKERDDFIEDYNKDLPEHAPDWYMFADKGSTIIRDLPARINILTGLPDDD